MLRHIAVIDLETTGPKYELGDRIFQFGCTLIDDDEIVEQISFNIHPEQSIPFDIQLLTGVTNQDVKSAPYFDEVAFSIYQLLEGRTIVAHNINFDGPFIASALKDALGQTIEGPFVDTVQLAQICYPTALSYRLSDLTKDLNIVHKNVHSAGSDAFATAHLFLKIMDKLRNLSCVTLEQLQWFSGGLVADTGRVIDEIYSEYQKKEDTDLPIEEGLVLSKEMLHPSDDENNVASIKASEAYERLVKMNFIQENKAQRNFLETLLEKIDTSDRLHFVESSPGSGKTYAYLLAALEKASIEQPIWIVTSNLLLQQQLVEDSYLPLVNALELGQAITSVKGQRNYIDLSSFFKVMVSKQEENSAKTSISMMGLLVWLTETKTGDLSECSTVLYQANLWKDISVQSIEEKKSLFWNRILNKVKRSAIVVTNHAFFIQYADSLVSTFKPIVLVDEVQQLEHALEQSGTLEVQFDSIFQLQQLWSDYHLNGMFTFSDKEEQFSRLVNRKILAICDFYEQWGENIQMKEEATSIVLNSDDWKQSIHYKMLKQIHRAVIELMNHIQATAIKATPIQETIEPLQALIEDLTILFGQNEGYFAVDETNHGGQIARKVLFAQPVIRRFRQLMSQVQQLIGISATVPVFSPLFFELNAKEKLSVIEKESTPIQHKLFLPTDLVSVTAMSSAQYHQQLVSCIKQIYELRSGRMLVLVHSIEALLELEQLLQQYCQKNQVELLAQKGPNMGRKIQRRFYENKNSILLGVYSFWEGFDASGHVIDSLVITKLPFPNPYTREQQIVQMEMEVQGRNYFSQYAIKMMLLQLYQGLGRFSRPAQQNSDIWILDVRASISKYAMQVKNKLHEEYKLIEKPFNKCLHVSQ